MGNNAYRMTIAGCERDLPFCPINDNLSIAAFIMFGDVEVTEKSAAELLKRCPEHDILITSEAKGIPLCYEMARQENKSYVVGRKSLKLYMTDYISVEVKSITTASVQTLYLSGSDAEKLKGKRVLIVDDVISTGASLLSLEKIVKMAGGEIVGAAAVLAEGEATKRKDIIFLNEIPLFEKE